MKFRAPCFHMIFVFVTSLFASTNLAAQDSNFTIPSFSVPDFSGKNLPVIQVPEISFPTDFDWQRVNTENFFQDNRFGSMAGLEELVVLQTLVAQFDFEKELAELLEAVQSGEMPAEEFIDRLGALFALYGDIAVAREASGTGSTCQHSACEIGGEWLLNVADPDKVREWMSGLDCTRAICTEELNPVILFPAVELEQFFQKDCSDTKCIPEELEDTWVGIDYKFLKKLTECNDARCEEDQENNPVLDANDDAPKEDPVVVQEEDEEEEDVVAMVDHSEKSTIYRYESADDMSNGIVSEITVVETNSAGATTSTHYAADYSTGGLQVGEQLSGAYYTGHGIANPSSHDAHVKLFSYPEGLFLVF